MKTVDTLVPDIYRMVTSKNLGEGVSLEEECDRFAQEMRDVMFEFMQNQERDNRKLRLSGVGKPDRQIWNSYNGIPGEDIEGATFIKFLYGHLVEAMMVALVRLSGHTVTDQQREVEVAGVTGHIDGIVDGVVMDVKSCSGAGFKKFKRNELHKDDPFGYVGQLKAYAHALDQTTYGWLAMDKTSGQICWLHYDSEDKDAPYAAAIDYDIEERVEDIKKFVASDVIPSQCYDEVSEGKSGNMRLDTGCRFCDYKWACFPDMREFSYAHGPIYYTHVEKEPRVLEIPRGF